MAVQTPFFGKRDNDAFGNRNNPVGAGNSQNSMMAGASRPAPIPAPATTAVDAGEKLVIYGSGKVRGEIRYGKIVIEEGGQLSGQIAVLGDSPAAKPALLEPAKSQPAAPVADTDAAAKLAVPVTAARVL